MQEFFIELKFHPTTLSSVAALWLDVCRRFILSTHELFSYQIFFVQPFFWCTSPFFRSTSMTLWLLWVTLSWDLFSVTFWRSETYPLCSWYCWSTAIGNPFLYASDNSINYPFFLELIVLFTRRNFSSKLLILKCKSEVNLKLITNNYLILRDFSHHS